MSLAAIDLNLLLVLHTVLAERSVARAAERLHVTPSAISNALARLRTALDDPLVTRKGYGIVPTPRAQALAPILARTLAELEQAVAPERFDARTCARTFSLALADVGQLAWLPRIVKALRAEMPQARIRAIGIESMVALGDLASGEVDVQLGVAPKLPGVHARKLFDEPMRLVARRTRHAREHVAVEMLPGKRLGDPVAAAYARAGVERTVVATVPTFSAAAALVASTDLVTTLPASLLALHKLKVLRAPVPITVPISLCWHERSDRDPALQAFRALIIRELS